MKNREDEYHSLLLKTLGALGCVERHADRLQRLCHRALGEFADIKDTGIEVNEDLYEELKEVCGYKE
jgi:hypothetical protein